MFSLFPRTSNRFLTADEQEQVITAVREAEQRTSGEVRVYIESRCTYVDPLRRAVELFHGLQMERTKEKNGVLVYVAMKDRQVAVFGDSGIHERVGEAFWQGEVQKMLQHFRNKDYASGLAAVVKDIGEVLHQHFPFDGATDKNELPDDIVFGA
jgi:uncharacterized membrane protein